MNTKIQTKSFFQIFKSFSTNLRKTQLFDFHKSVLKGKMTEFSGYEMPLQYPMGIMKEHLHCREHAAFFDVSHMGQLK